MREREFIKTLNLLAETEKAPDLSAKIMRGVKKEKLFGMLVKSALTFPLMLILAFASVRLISETEILKFVLTVIPVPNIFLGNPALSVFIYAVAISVYASILVSTYIEGGDINGALLLSPGKRRGSGMFEVRKTAL
jgi:hypothetical protein